MESMQGFVVHVSWIIQSLTQPFIFASMSQLRYPNIWGEITHYVLGVKLPADVIK